MIQNNDFDTSYRKKSLWVITFIIFLMGCHTSEREPSEKGTSLKFGTDGSFKIAQVTDIHLHHDDAEEVRMTKNAIQNVWETEDPDLFILTGDIVNSPADKGWETIAGIFSEFGIPWAVTLGNHDDEDVWSRNEIFDFLEKQPGFIGKKGPDISGTGNYIIPLLSSESQQEKALLYFFDSHAYPENPNRGSYDWIKFDQIEWYRNKSSEYTKQNDQKPLPALAFFHIPLPEYAMVEKSPTFMGRKEEGVFSPDINSGMFAAFVEMKDVMGTFVGHDHNNNYIGIHHEVALAFGQVSGYGGYGDFSRGSRIIELSEGEYGFNTWIRNLETDTFHYNYPFGATFKEQDVDYVAAVKEPDQLIRGLSYHYFEGKFSSVNEMKGLQPLKSGKVKNINIDIADVEDHFGFEFSGYIRIPYKGIYNFYTFSDDGSQLFINDSLVVDNDGSHSLQRKDGTIALEEGYHSIKILYFEDYMGQKMEAGISGLKVRETKITDDMVFTEP
ncbi:MAG: PA14 domain-containing protein [Bacteroidota bacterium]